MIGLTLRSPQSTTFCRVISKVSATRSTGWKQDVLWRLEGVLRFRLDRDGLKGGENALSTEEKDTHLISQNKVPSELEKVFGPSELETISRASIRGMVSQRDVCGSYSQESSW